MKLSAGSSSVTAAIPIVFDDLEEGEETFTLKVDNYNIGRKLGGEKHYRENTPLLLQRSSVSPLTFTVEDQESILGQTISQNGGQGNFSFNAPFAPGQIVNGQFTSFSIPDQLIVRDGSTELLNTGSVSVTNKPIGFTIPENSAGNITISVKAPLGGTLWNFSLTSENPGNRRTNDIKDNNNLRQTISPLRSSSSSFLSPLTIAAALGTDPYEATSSQKQIENSWVLITNTGSVILEDEVLDTPGASFRLERRGELGSEALVKWRIKPIGDNPISAADFDGGVLPEGTFVFDSGQVSSEAYFFGYIDEERELDAYGIGFVKDDIVEFAEAFTVELVDVDSGEVIVPSAPYGKEWEVYDDFGYLPSIQGTDDGELLVGDDNDNTIEGKSGDDTVNGLGGDDLLLGNNGNDVINGGAGDDVIEGGFGNDTIDGGPGNDTVRIPRPQSNISLTQQKDSSYLVEDLSDVSLGTDSLVNVERVIFSDGFIELDISQPSTNLLGTDGDDTIIGTDADETIDALGGNDVVAGGLGDDKIFGGDGDDVLRGD